MTLEYLTIDLSDVFECGMTYVAMSRGVTCDHMCVKGFKKEDVTGEVKDGYLIIKASTKNSKDEKDAKGKYIRKERYEGSCNRSFYVGDAITQDDIKAKFEDGVLKISVPKKEAKPQVEEKKFIAIEG